MSVVLFIVVLVQAQQDEKAKNILNEVSEKTRSYSTISADFSFAMENKEMEIEEKTEGTIKLKGQKYVVDLPSVNNGVKVYSDGETLWNYMSEGNQVTISNVEEDGSELMDPSALFTIYEKGFDSKFIAEKKVAGKTVFQIELFPSTNEYDVSKILISIDKATMMIQAATLHSTDGNIYSIKVKKMETDKEFPASDFIFNSNDYPDLEEIDWR